MKRIHLVLCALLAPAALPAAAAELDVDIERDRQVITNDDGSTTIERSYERSVTNEETGKTRTLEHTDTLMRGPDGREWSSETTRTGPNGGERSRSSEGSVVRNGDGTRTRSGSRTRSATAPDGHSRSSTRDYSRTQPRGNDGAHASARRGPRQR